ncbi:MAG: sulfotransferase domain-containing protein [Actinobacteria bacterium]|nr:MAG: sulfotransferase domain-containing protein [Actinomycetota bacterium]
MRDDEPSPLPQSPSRGRDVAAEGAQLLRRRAQLAAGTRLVRRPFRAGRTRARRKLPALHEPACVRRRFAAHVVPAARIVYVVRDPIDRMLSHYMHNVGGGYDERPIEEALADPQSSYVTRSRYFFQLEPYLDAFGSGSIQIVSREELKNARPETMRRAFEFCGVDPNFTSEQFEREWETGVAKTGSRFRVMDRAVRLPGLRALDRNFDRFPESLRWIVERLVHDPEGGEAPKPELPLDLRDELVGLFREDTARLEELAGRQFGWLT